MKKAKVYMHDHYAGILTEDDTGYHFQYEKDYLNMKDPEPISLTIPLSKKIYSSNILFPFFDGLIPEGWLLDIAQNNWKLNDRDRMGLIMVVCRDCIGAVSIQPIENKDHDEK